MGDKQKLWSGDMVREVSQECGISQDMTRRVISAFIQSISDSLAAGKAIGLVGIGTIKVREIVSRISMGYPPTEEETVRKLELYPAGRLRKALRLYSSWPAD